MTHSGKIGQATQTVVRDRGGEHERPSARHNRKTLAHIDHGALFLFPCTLCEGADKRTASQSVLRWPFRQALARIPAQFKEHHLSAYVWTVCEALGIVTTNSSITGDNVQTVDHAVMVRAGEAVTVLKIGERRATVLTAEVIENVFLAARMALDAKPALRISKTYAPDGRSDPLVDAVSRYLCDEYNILLTPCMIQSVLIVAVTATPVPLQKDARSFARSLLTRYCYEHNAYPIRFDEPLTDKPPIVEPGPDPRRSKGLVNRVEKVNKFPLLAKKSQAAIEATQATEEEAALEAYI